MNHSASIACLLLKYCATGLLLFGALLLGAQGQPPFHLKTYTTEHGLPPGHLVHIFEDRDGFIWVFGEAGLSRFDGASFTFFPFDAAPAGDLSGWQRSPFWYKEAGLDGLWYFDRNTFKLKTLNTIGAITAREGDKIALTENDTLWYSTDRYALLKVHAKTGVILDSFNYSGQRNFITWGFCDRTHNRYFAFRQSTQWLRIRAGSRTPEWLSFGSVIPKSAIRITCHNLVEDAAGWMWTGTWGMGLLGFHPASEKFILYPATPLDRFRRVEYTPALSGDSTLWCMDAGNGIYLFDVRHRRFVRHLLYDKNQPDGLPGNNIYASLVDRRGALWFTTSGGLSRIAPEEQYFFNMQAPTIRDRGEPVPFDLAPRFVLRENGNLFWAYYGLRSFGLFDSRRNKPLRRITFFSNGTYFQCFPSHSPGGVWMFGGARDTLVIAGPDNRTFRVLKLPPIPGVKDKYFTKVFEFDGCETLWLGTNEGLMEFNLAENRVRRLYRSKEDDRSTLSGRDIKDLHLDASGRLWLATPEGLNCLDPRNGRVQRYPTPDRRKNGQWISSVKTDSRGIVWYSTLEAGLFRLDPRTGQVEHFIPDTANVHLYYHALYIDRLDRVWLTSADGLFLFDPAARRFEKFTRADGLAFQNFGGEMPFFPYRDGVGITGRNGAFTWFRPEQIPLNPEHPTPYIQSVSTPGRSIPFDPGNTARSPVELNHDDRYITITFTTPVFARRHRLRFRYRLLGLDDDWQEAGNTQQAVFAKLPPGDYTFEVIACMEGGPWSERAAGVRIRVWPPWWENGLFRVSLVAVLFGLAYLFYRFRLRQKQILIENQLVALENQRLQLEREQLLTAERNRVAAELHDDLGAGLSTIRFLSARATMKETDPGKRRQVEKISQSAAELMENMRDIIWAMNSRNDTLENLLSYLRAYAAEYLETHGLACRIDMPAGIPEQPLSGERRRNILLTVKEALHNAVRHARATEVALTIRLNGNLEIDIRDNGVGLSGENGFGNGLRYMQKRMTAIGGGLEVVNGQGVTVRLWAPMGEFR